jgi:ribosomal protein S18 acetylase RimI-like enzyme
LYWIAVHPAAHGQGIGKKLLVAVEGELRAAHARWLVAETSAMAEYESTRHFYLRTGFDELGNIPDFYRQGDGRLTYAKRL